MLSVAKEQNLRCTQMCAAEACPSTMLHCKLSKGRVSVEGLLLLHSQRFSLKKTSLDPYHSTVLWKTLIM